MQYTLYVRDGCPYCVRAIKYLNYAGLDYKIVQITADLKAELWTKSHISTVPQLFRDDTFLGDSVWIENNLGDLI